MSLRTINQNNDCCSKYIAECTHIVYVDSVYYKGLFESNKALLTLYPNKEIHFCGHIYNNEIHDYQVDVEHESMTRIIIEDDKKIINYTVDGNEGVYTHEPIKYSEKEYIDTINYRFNLQTKDSWQRVPNDGTIMQTNCISSLSIGKHRYGWFKMRNLGTKNAPTENYHSIVHSLLNKKMDEIPLTPTSILSIEREEINFMAPEKVEEIKTPATEEARVQIEEIKRISNVTNLNMLERLHRWLYNGTRADNHNQQKVLSVTGHAYKQEMFIYQGMMYIWDATAMAQYGKMDVNNLSMYCRMKIPITKLKTLLANESFLSSVHKQWANFRTLNGIDDDYTPDENLIMTCIVADIASSYKLSMVQFRSQSYVIKHTETEESMAEAIKPNMTEMQKLVDTIHEVKTQTKLAKDIIKTVWDETLGRINNDYKEAKEKGQLSYKYTIKETIANAFIFMFLWVSYPLLNLDWDDNNYYYGSSTIFDFAYSKYVMAPVLNFVEDNHDILDKLRLNYGLVLFKTFWFKTMKYISLNWLLARCVWRGILQGLSLILALSMIAGIILACFGSIVGSPLSLIDLFLALLSIYTMCRSPTKIDFMYAFCANICYYGFPQYAIYFWIPDIIICLWRIRANDSFWWTVLSFSVVGRINAQGVFEVAKTISASCTPNDMGQFIHAIQNLRQIKGMILRCPDLTKIECDAKHNPRLIQKFQIYNGNFIQKNYPYKLHSCSKNLVESIGRQLSCVVRPELDTVAKLQPMVDEYIMKLKKVDMDFPTIDEFIGGYQGMQKRLYAEAYENYFNGKKFNIKSMKMHTKIDEKIKIAYGDGVKAKTKARNITAQNDISKVIMGPLIQHISNLQKEMDDGYGSGLTHEDRCEKFEQWYNLWPKTRILCLDGSAFDSTQHIEILKMIDEQIYVSIANKYRNEISSYCNFNDLKKIITNWDQLVTAKEWQYLIHGTQATGKMNTSQGNTTRSLFYTRFIGKMAGLTEKDFKVEASGDDTIIFIDDSLAEKYMKCAFEHVYTKDDKNETPFGLGQIAKKFDVYHEITGVEYLSCHLVRNYDDKIMMIRKLDRFLQLNGWTMNNPKLNQNKQKEYNKMLVRGEAINILSYCNDLRIFSTVAKTMLRFTEGVEASEKDINKWTKREDGRKLKFNEQYEEMLFKLYKIDKTDIDHFCEKLTKSTSMYQEFSFDLVDKIEGVRDCNTYATTSAFIFRVSDYDAIDVTKKTITYHPDNGKSEKHNDIIVKN